MKEKSNKTGDKDMTLFIFDDIFFLFKKRDKNIWIIKSGANVFKDTKIFIHTFIMLFLIERMPPAITINIMLAKHRGNSRHLNDKYKNNGTIITTQGIPTIENNITITWYKPTLNSKKKYGIINNTTEKIIIIKAIKAYGSIFPNFFILFSIMPPFPIKTKKTTPYKRLPL